MKTPLNPLPWETFDSAGNITIESSHPFGEDCVCMELYKQDSEYLVQACNNFPKSVELLNKIVAEYYKDPESLYSRIQIIEEFLKEIES